MTRTRQCRDGFTLVELLVAITIIVVLLSLLSPALDKAMTAASLAVCASNQKAIASAGAVYAQSNRSRYPHPKLARDGNDMMYQPDIIGWEADPDRDIRALYEPYIPYAVYGCPMSPGIKFDFESNDVGTTVQSNYAIFMAWAYVGGQGGPGMFRMGDRLEYYDSWNGRDAASSVVVMDRAISNDTGGGQSAHPDDESQWRLYVWNNRDGFTHTAWGYGSRSQLDVNQTYVDLSVSRVDDLLIEDERVAYAAAHANATHQASLSNKILIVPR